MRRWLIGLTVALVAASTMAAPAAAATEISLSAGYAGLFVPSRHVPVSVQISADRLLRATLEVVVRPEANPDAAVSRVRQPVEVPGGSSKSYLVVAPPVVSFGPPAAVVTARLLDGSGNAIATSERESLRADSTQELVGILPGSLTAGEPPPAVPLAVEAGVARLVELGRAELAQAPASLAPLGTVAAGADDLAALADPVRQGLLRWLGDGGTLLVDAAPGSLVDGLPEPWQPGPEGHGPAGLGRVRLTNGAMAAGSWDRLIEPTPTGADDSSRFGFGGPMGSIGDALAVDAGLRVPGIGWLVTFLVVYVVVVGPVTAIVLGRRGRSELAWVVIPAVAVVFTGLAYAGARQVRGSTKLAHGTTVEVDAGGARSTTFVGLAARTRETKEISFPNGWTASANPTTALSRFTGSPSATSTENTRRGPAARLELGAGQFGVASAAGPAASSGGLSVTAHSAGDGQAAGTVRNDTPYALEETAVFVGGLGTSLGRLEPGEERQWAMPADGRRRVDENEFDPFMGPEATVWPEVSGRFGRIDHDSVVNFPLWQVTAGNQFLFRPSGVAVAVGWTREHRPAVLVDGQARRPVGRTALIARTPVEPRGRITDTSVRSEVVRGMSDFVDGPGRAGPPQLVVRATLPSGRRPVGRLVATIFDGGGPGGADVWLDGRWQGLQPDAAPGQAQAPVPVAPEPAMRGPLRVIPDRFGPSTDYVVPPGAVQRGLVFLRVPAAGDPRQMNVSLREPAS